MPTVVEPADPRRAPPSNVLRQIHRNLPTETGTALVPQHTTVSKMVGDCRFDLFQRQTPDSVSVTSITLLSTIDIFQRLGVFVGHGIERPTLEEQHLRTDEVYGSAGGDVGSK